MTDLTREELQALRDRARQAIGEITKLASAGGDTWRMCIPAHRDDSDLLLYEVAKLALTLADLLDAAQNARQNVFEAAKKEIESLRMVLDIAKSDIEEAIYMEDGLDAGDGEGTMQLIDEARTGKFPADLNDMFQNIQDWRTAFYAGGE